MTLALLVALAGPPLVGRATTLVLVAMLLVAALPLTLRQRATPWWITNWRRGAAGERHAARILGRLGRHGYWLLNDLQVPGSKANLDHLLIGPTGVFYVDAKQWKGTLRLGRDGRLWHNGRSCAKRLRTVRWEARQAQDALVDLDVRVRPVVVIFDAALPARQFMVDGLRRRRRSRHRAAGQDRIRPGRIISTGDMFGKRNPAHTAGEAIGPGAGRVSRYGPRRWKRTAGGRAMQPDPFGAWVMRGQEAAYAYGSSIGRTVSSTVAPVVIAAMLASAGMAWRIGRRDAGAYVILIAAARLVQMVHLLTDPGGGGADRRHPGALGAGRAAMRLLGKWNWVPAELA